MRVITAITSLFCYLGAHFLQIKGNGEESKVHGNLVFVEVSESFVRHIVLHLAENSLGFNSSPSPMFYSFF